MVGIAGAVMLLGGEQGAAQYLWPRPPAKGGHWNLGTLLARHRMRISDTWPPAAGHSQHRAELIHKVAQFVVTVPERRLSPVWHVTPAHRACMTICRINSNCS